MFICGCTANLNALIKRFAYLCCIWGGGGTSPKHFSPPTPFVSLHPLNRPTDSFRDANRGLLFVRSPGSRPAYSSRSVICSGLLIGWSLSCYVMSRDIIWTVMAKILMRSTWFSEMHSHPKSLFPRDVPTATLRAVLPHAAPLLLLIFVRYQLQSLLLRLRHKVSLRYFHIPALFRLLFRRLRENIFNIFPRYSYINIMWRDLTTIN